MISAVRKARPCRIGPHRCGGALVALFALVVFALVVVPRWFCPGGGAGCALVWCAPVVCALVVVPGDGCALVVLPWWLCPGGCALVEVVPLVVVP